MLHNTSTFALPLALVLCTGTAMQATQAATPGTEALKAERPEVKVGDRWKFACTGSNQKTERRWEITSVEPTVIKGKENGQPLTLTPDLNELESPRRKLSENKTLSFPLEVGKKWEFANNAVLYGVVQTKTYRGEGQEKYAVSVDSYEKVRVPAGEFDAYKLAVFERFTDIQGAIFTTDSVLWYAPAARSIVKSDWVVHAARRGTEHSCELVDFQLQP